MRKRLYFILPDVGHCQQLVAELKDIGAVPEHDIHVVARDDISLGNLPRATILQKTELAHGLELGLLVGGGAGALAGLLTIFFPPAGLNLNPIAMVIVMIITTFSGIGFGIIVSGLVARDIPNHELDNFQTRISFGEILLILDIPTHRVNKMIQLIKNTHPEAKIGVVKPSALQTSTIS